MLGKLLCKLGVHAVVETYRNVDEWNRTRSTAFGCVRYGCKWQGQYDN